MNSPLHDDEILLLIGKVRPLYRTLVAAVDARLAGTGLSVALRGVLEVLGKSGPLTVPQIARAHGVGRQFVQRLIDQAEADGLVEKRANPHHQRSVLFDLSKRGRAVLSSVLRRELAVVRQVAKGLSRADVLAAHRVVDHMIEAFGPN